MEPSSAFKSVHSRDSYKVLYSVPVAKLMWHSLGLVTFTLCLSSVTLVTLTEGCNQEKCASLVSKCQLLGSCECDVKDKSSCANCSLCLGQKYPICCSCVGLCDINPSDSVANTSSVEDLNDPIPNLFDTLTLPSVAAGVDSMWTVHSYPITESIMLTMRRAFKDVELERGPDNKYVYKVGGRVVGMSDAVNCTVAYMNDCTTLPMCKEMCSSMGSARFRWFHDSGCCECVSDKCVDYGKNVPMCQNCPRKDGGNDQLGGKWDGEDSTEWDEDEYYDNDDIEDDED